MSDSISIPVVGFAAYSGTGKTTLLKQLIPLLKKSGVRIALIKHSHHDFEIDVPGKDSYELREAGADQVLIGSSHRWVLIHENSDLQEPLLEEMLEKIDASQVDIILVEGFRHESFPKIELRRSKLDKPAIFPEDSSIIAVAADYKPVEASTLPWLDINNPDEIAGFIRDKFL